MSRHLTAAVVALGLSIALGTVTSAADLGSPAPAPIYTKAPVLAPWSWTGFYVGGNVGYGWGRADNTDSFVSPCPICLVNPPDFATLLATGSNNIGGVIGGGQFGYNWQATNFLLGIEAD
jgi:outer membrane immunogenic protein